MAQTRSFRIKTFPLPNGVKRPENSQPSRGLQVKQALPAQGPGQGSGKGGGQKDAHPA